MDDKNRLFSMRELLQEELDTVLAAGLSDSRSGYRAQTPLFKVASRWRRVSRMDNPVAYARRILVNLALHGSPKRSRNRAELKATPPAETAAIRGMDPKKNRR